ncbi:hypothetical protein L9F63_021164, partial [Diploptera punctata]
PMYFIGRRSLLLLLRVRVLQENPYGLLNQTLRDIQNDVDFINRLLVHAVRYDLISLDIEKIN